MFTNSVPQRRPRGAPVPIYNPQPDPSGPQTNMNAYPRGAPTQPQLPPYSHGDPLDDPFLVNPGTGASSRENSDQNVSIPG
jgi:hypothetical protein